MLLSQIKGLKYPDEYFIKFFFKNALHTKKALSFLEFGCSNGNNLLLPYHYEHNVVGVDLSKKKIADAKYNFSNQNLQNKYEFYAEDMVDFTKKSLKSFDVISLPNIINYLSKDRFLEFLENLKINNFYKEDVLFFIRFRSPKDFRNGYGKEIGKNSYIVEDDLTSEKGAINSFYDDIEMVDILRKYLNLYEFQIFHIDFENLAKDKIIFNSDIIIWGKIS